MTTRNLRILRTDLPLVLGVCEACGMQFKSEKPDLLKAGGEVKSQFDAHACKDGDDKNPGTRVGAESTSE
jgi:hypothetical protein